MKLQPERKARSTTGSDAFPEESTRSCKVAFKFCSDETDAIFFKRNLERLYGLIKNLTYKTFAEGKDKNLQSKGPF